MYALFIFPASYNANTVNIKMLTKKKYRINVYVLDHEKNDHKLEEGGFHFADIDVDNVLFFLAFDRDEHLLLPFLMFIKNEIQKKTNFLVNVLIITIIVLFRNLQILFENIWKYIRYMIIF